MSASKIVTVVRDGEAAAEVIVLTQPVSIKQTGPKETINAYRSRRSTTTTEPIDEPARMRLPKVSRIQANGPASVCLQISLDAMSRWC
jgi:hypothetical protein